MVELFSAKYISLHVRETNFAAFHLYSQTLKFEVKGMEAKYYADGENAHDMRKTLTREQFGLPPLPLLVVPPPQGGGSGAAAKQGRLADAAPPPPTSVGEEAADGAEAKAEAAAGAAADIEPGKGVLDAVTAAMASAKIKNAAPDLD
jgi:hypothetical protein